MKKFLITNTDRFEGQAVLIYNEKGTLCIIDVSDTNMDQQTMLHFKQAAPVTTKDLQRAFKAPTVIVEGSYEITFEKFYKDYPLKRNRMRAEKSFAKLDKTDQIKAWHAISAYKKYLSRASWQSPMMADTFITKREFETEWHKVK